MTRDNEQLRLLSFLEISTRFMADAPIEVPDVSALFRLVSAWYPELLHRVLQRIADPRAPEVSVALAVHIGASTDRFTHADLARIRQMLVRTAAQESDPRSRALHQTAIRDCTVALNGRPGAFRVVTESTHAVVELSSSHRPERCRPHRHALSTMMDLAWHPERMPFILRVDERRPSASSAR